MPCMAGAYGVPQERWRLILRGSRKSAIAPPEPTHYATGRANFRGGGTMKFQLTDTDKKRLLPGAPEPALGQAGRAGVLWEPDLPGGPTTPHPPHGRIW